MVVETPTKRPLDGVRVIDLSNYVSGPFAGMMLADLGADVIKVEQPQGGDPTRRIGRRLEGGVSGLFFNTNRNKRSIALDLKAPDDVSVLLDLVVQFRIYSKRTSVAAPEAVPPPLSTSTSPSPATKSGSPAHK